MRSRNRTTLLLAAAIGLLVTTTLTAEAQQIKLKFSSFEPPTAALTARVMTPWAAEVSKASGGNLQIDMYPGGILGRNPLTQLKLVQDGVADIAWIVLAYTPGRFDDADVVGRRYLELHEVIFDSRAHRDQTVRRARESPLGAPRQPGFDRAVVPLQYVAVVDVHDDG